jgi:hypothetical protein
MIKFSLTNLFPDFHKFYSSNIDKEELEEIIRGAVGKDDPDATIKELKYTKDGVIVILDNKSEIEIEIDWQEIILD